MNVYRMSMSSSVSMKHRSFPKKNFYFYIHLNLCTEHVNLSDY